MDGRSIVLYASMMPVNKSAKLYATTAKYVFTCTHVHAWILYHTICKLHLICSNQQGRLNITLPVTSMQDIGIPETKPLLHSSIPEEKLNQSLSRIRASCTCENDLHLAENHVLSAVNILLQRRLTASYNGKSS